MIYVKTDHGKVDIFSTVKNLTEDETTNQNLAKPLSKINYVICMTARSGSTMLCSLLKNTNLLGFPEEYVNPRGPMNLYLKKLPSENIIDYFDKLRRVQVSSNGVFGMKTNFPDFKPILDNSLVGTILNPVKFIYLDREDVLLQAISSYLARKTGVWHQKHNQKQRKTEIDIDSEINQDEIKKILKIMDKLTLEKLEWEKFFSLYSIEPLKIKYEEILKKSDQEIQKISEFLNISLSNKVDISMAETKKMGNEINLRIAQLIREKHTL